MAGSSLLAPAFPAVNSPQRLNSPGNRNKVILKPGRSLMDWIRLGRSGKDLTGFGGKTQDVELDELRKHNTEDNAWIAVRGKVYNVTPYMEFHPGGIEELMKGIGKESTALFDEIHKWVNADSMLEKCFVGRLKTDIPTTKKRVSLPQVINLLPPSGPAPPRYEWTQTEKLVTITVYTKWTSMQHDLVIIDNAHKELLISMYIDDCIYYVHQNLEDEVTTDYEVKVAAATGKVNIVLHKQDPGRRWSALGKALSQNCKYIKKSDAEIRYRTCKLQSLSEVSHDTKLFCICLPAGTRMCIPLGYHVHIKRNISGMEITRSFTVVVPSLNPDKQDRDVELGRVIYLMMKVYSLGALTPCLNNLYIGDEIEVSDFDGNFATRKLEKSNQIVLFAAGTGFTPMIRLLYETFNKESLSKIKKIHLMLFNKKERDILWRDHIEKLAENNNNRLSLEYVLSEAGDNWQGLTGRIRMELVQRALSAATDKDKTLVCACGPTPFTRDAIRFAEELGYDKDMLHAFLG